MPVLLWDIPAQRLVGSTFRDTDDAIRYLMRLIGNQAMPGSAEWGNYPWTVSGHGVRGTDAPPRKLADYQLVTVS